jgi:hypothetical protein
MKKMPIQNLKVWVHDLDMVIVMLENPWKKQLVGFICSINKINDEFTSMSIKKGFFVKNMEDKILHNIVV